VAKRQVFRRLGPEEDVYILATHIKVCDRQRVVDVIYSYDAPGVELIERCRGHNTGHNRDLISKHRRY